MISSISGIASLPYHPLRVIKNTNQKNSSDFYTSNVQEKYDDKSFVFYKQNGTSLKLYNKENEMSSGRLIDIMA